MEWIIEYTDGFESRFKKHSRKYPGETARAFEHLLAYLDDLNKGINPLQMHGRGVRREPNGSISFDESGGGSDPHPTRLYAFPDQENEILWVITIGDKNTQKRRDIPDCRSFIKTLRKKRDDDG